MNAIRFLGAGRYGHEQRPLRLLAILTAPARSDADCRGAVFAEAFDFPCFASIPKTPACLQVATHESTNAIGIAAQFVRASQIFVVPSHICCIVSLAQKQNADTFHRI
jgi:hypothetical protein